MQAKKAQMFTNIREREPSQQVSRPFLHLFTPSRLYFLRFRSVSFSLVGLVGGLSMYCTMQTQTTSLE